MAKSPIDIRSLARSHTETAIRTLASIMNMSDAPHAARISAAEALLDRGWGKPKQMIEHSGEINTSELADHELGAMLSAVRAAAASRVGETAGPGDAAAVPPAGTKH
jgi:hypothetical protein